MLDAGLPPNDSPCALPPVMDGRYADELKSNLLQALGAGHDIHLDASDVARISALCLQVLVAGRKAFVAHGSAQLKIVNASSAFLESVRSTGLADCLGLLGDCNV